MHQRTSSTRVAQAGRCAGPAGSSKPWLAAAAACLSVVLFAGAAVAQKGPDAACRDGLTKLSDDKGLGLGALLDSIGPERAAQALQRTQCDAPDMHVAEVVEEAVRAFTAVKSPGDGAVSLYLSPSQRVEIRAVEGGVPSADVFEVVTAAAPWWAPDGTLGTWEEILTDMNARTHHLEAQLATLDDRALSLRAPGARLSATLLATAAYIELAQAKHPAVWTRLTGSTAQIDALRLLWERAEAALGQLQSRRPVPSPVMAAAHARIPVMTQFYRAASVRPPAYNQALGGSDGPPVGSVPAVAPDAGPAVVAGSATAVVGSVPAADAGPSAGPDAGAAASGAVPQPIAEVPSAPPASDVPSAPSAPEAAPAAPAATGDASTPEATQEGYGGWIALGVAAAVPWLWMALLWGLSRRKNQLAYLRLGNRTIAVATLIVVFECLCAAAVLRPSNLELLANRWALGLLWPIYAFVVVTFMLSRLDRSDRLEARRLMRKWGKWGGGLVIILAVVNSIVLAFFSPIATFFLFPSLGIVGLLGVTFLVKLWRTGDQVQAAPVADGPEKAPEGVAVDPADPSPPAAPKGEAKPAAPKPTPAKAAKASPAPSTPPAAAAPRAGSEAGPVDDGIDPVDDGADNPASAMSDDDLIAALEAMDKGAPPDKDVPPDRAELYKLLDD